MDEYMDARLGVQDSVSDKTRQGAQTGLGSCVLGPFVLDTAANLLLLDGTTVALGERAVAILLALVRRGGLLVTKDRLLTESWNSLAVEESNQTVQISNLRRAPGGESRADYGPAD
jgi:DNA-binding winged helix-turn-helix (wHTH) protein